MTELVYLPDGSVMRPGPGFSAEALADAWVVKHALPGAVPGRPEVLSEAEWRTHPACIAQQQADADVLAALLTQPTLQDVIDSLDARFPGVAEDIAARARQRAGSR
jgi:hypothetical protein